VHPGFDGTSRVGEASAFPQRRVDVSGRFRPCITGYEIVLPPANTKGGQD